MINNIQRLIDEPADRRIDLICKDLFQRVYTLTDEDAPQIEEISRIAKEALQPAEALERFLPLIEDLPPVPSLIAASNRCLACFYNRVSPDLQPKIIRASPILALCRDLGIEVQADDVLENEASLIAAVKLCAVKDGMKVLSRIQSFGIRDQAALIAIAKICAARDLRDAYITTVYIGGFGIKDEGALIEIAKICATQNPERTALNIRNFGIKDEDALIEVAKVCAAQDGQITAKNIKQFVVPMPRMIKEILPLCAIQNPRSLAHLGKAAPDGPDPASFRLLFTDADQPWNQVKAETILNEYIAKRLPDCGCGWVLNHLSNIKDPHARKEATISIAAALFILRHNLTDDQLRSAGQEGFIQSVYELHSPHLYLPLVGQVAHFYNERAFDEFSKIKPLRLEGYHPFLKLLRVMLAHLTAQGVNTAPIIALLDGKQYKTFKDVFKAKLLLTVLMHLANASNLTPDQKSAVLEKLDSHDAAVAASLIFDLKAGALLQDISEGLIKISQQAIKGTLPLEGVEDPAARFTETFEASRYPLALWQYAAKMKSLNDPALIQCLGEYAVSVFKGTFKEERYDLKRNPHLTKLEQASPGIVDRWRQGMASDLGAVDTDDPYLLFFCGTDVAGSCQRIDENPALNKGLLGYLMNGPTRLLAVTNKSGRILARSLLRLLWDGEKPVLFLERLYGDKSLQENILNLAKDKAQKMGLALTAQNPEGNRYGKTLHSLGGRAPFEYCDAKEGVTTGVFAIQNAAVVN